MNQVHSNDPVSYDVTVKGQTASEVLFQMASEEAVIDAAFEILKKRIRKAVSFESPADVRAFMVMNNARQADQHRERFTVMYLDSQNKLLSVDELFVGSLTSTSVYPKEVVRAALRHNAAACLLSHNHPSNCPTPSRADEMLTQSLKAALALVDVRVLDHFIVTSDGQCVSMAEMGLV